MKILIIGNGMVGYKCCEKLLKHPSAREHTITIFGEEVRPAYDRVHLSDFFAGKSAEDLCMAPAAWYAENGIRLHLGDPVQDLDTYNKTITSYKGLEEKYDILLLATGSAAFVPAIPGAEKRGVFIYRTLEDLEAIADYASKARSAAVIGGGLLGLEAAKAMIDLQIPETHVIEFAPRLMPRQVDEPGSRILRDKLESLGLHIHTKTNTTAIEGEEYITGMSFSDGSHIKTDMLVISAGIKPRDELARQAGLAVGSRGGIMVNEYMQTSDPHIYAVGECALFNEMIYGLVAPGYEMAEVAVSHMLGGEKKFTGFDMSTKLKLVGIDVASFGDPFIQSGATRSVVFEDTLKGIYKRINITADGKELLGGILIGEAEGYNLLLQMSKNRTVLPPNPEDLLVGGRSKESAPGAGIAGLPDTAVICSCEGVCKGTIGDLVKNGAETPEAVKKITGAGTGCGGCMPMVKDLVVLTLQSIGKYVRNMVCEHFSYSRQELYDLVKLKDLHSFEEVLDGLGKGDGCEICKPVISSILASLWNEMILKKGNDTAQDSNDRYLANIQKGGSYSVVPRIPGGEITPDKLIVIGQVAKKYTLYTKITGGQRIDLFGALLGDLPAIWKELVDAGFESGHAYGKALRTVKSCVGSTWCRFGLHDSVSFAIRIEERYRGLRAPHKIKGGVSGCIRECAEAQSKDFGIIATEKGWNLHVCGNGGSKPQHALLLASDLDSDTCIRYIDRFLMFYIRTADPLSRTAAWLNKMEGGIDYLRNVVVNDSLGMGEALEKEMQALVNGYRCEWKEVIGSPELQKRFQHFVNAPGEHDPSIRFEGLRDQKKAVDWK